MAAMALSVSMFSHFGAEPRDVPRLLKYKGLLARWEDSATSTALFLAAETAAPCSIRRILLLRLPSLAA